MEFGEVRLLVGMTSSITPSKTWLELWCRIFGFVVPSIFLDRGCKQRCFEYTDNKGSLNFSFIVFRSWYALNVGSIK